MKIVWLGLNYLERMTRAHAWLLAVARNRAIDYLRSAVKSNEPQPRRRDPLSVYLDVLEQQTQQ